jgi:hypothetical protein
VVSVTDPRERDEEMPEKDSPYPMAFKGLSGFVEEVERLHSLLKGNSSFQLAGARGEARTFIACALWAVHRGPLVMVLPDIRTRNHAAQVLAAFCKILSPLLEKPDETQIMSFPSWELTPYLDEWMQPSVASLRVKGLFALLERKPVALLTTPEAL